MSDHPGYAACDRCGQNFDIDEMRSDDAGNWCHDCLEIMDAAAQYAAGVPVRDRRVATMEKCAICGERDAETILAHLQRRPRDGRLLAVPRQGDRERRWRWIMTATPRPWVRQGVNVVAPPTEDRGSGTLVCQGIGGTASEAGANASLIVRAVNHDHAFDALVAACDAAIKEESCSKRVDIQLRAALKLAKGDPQ